MRYVVYYKVRIIAGLVASYAGAFRGGDELGGIGWKTGFPVLEFYREHRGAFSGVLIG